MDCFFTRDGNEKMFPPLFAVLRDFATCTGAVRQLAPPLGDY
jgi:hypothetical protein